MQITYFVHSITDDNEQGLATGWLEGSLSEEGVKRAKKLEELRADDHFDAVFCSDLRRATESCDLFFKGAYPVLLDWRLRECNYGDFDGRPATEFKKGRETEYIQIPYPNGESYLDVERRMKNFLRDAHDHFSNGHIAIVAHQAPQLALDVITKQQTWHQAIENDWRKTQAWQPGWAYQFSE